MKFYLWSNYILYNTLSFPSLSSKPHFYSALCIPVSMANRTHLHPHIHTPDAVIKPPNSSLAESGVFCSVLREECAGQRHAGKGGWGKKISALGPCGTNRRPPFKLEACSSLGLLFMFSCGIKYSIAYWHSSVTGPGVCRAAWSAAVVRNSNSALSHVSLSPSAPLQNYKHWGPKPCN